MLFTSISRAINVYSLPIDPDRASVLGPMQALNSRPGSVQLPSVSAGGSKVLYVSDNSGVRDLWSKDVNDKTEEPVTQFRPIGYRPALSADGKRVVYPSWQNGHCVVYMQSAAITSRPVALKG